MKYITEKRNPKYFTASYIKQVFLKCYISHACPFTGTPRF